MNASRQPSPTGRAVSIGVLVVLAATVVWLWATVIDFGQTRFFTVDEYQYGHATWLVTQGQRPYVDFYEHHFPGSYVFNAPLLPRQGSLERRALQLRTISTGYLLAMSLVIGLAAHRATRNSYLALLLSGLPLAFGFSLMSAVDYRNDNFAAVLYVVAVALVELNRERAGRWTAFGTGVIFALASAMTQKMLALSGATVGVYLAIDVFRRLRGGEAAPPIVARPLALVAGGGLTAVLLLVVAAAAGLLGPGYQATIVEAVKHEALYPHVWATDYFLPYLSETAATTVPILAFALFFAIAGRQPVWAVALVVTALIGSRIRAQYPYNYVLLGWLLTICAVRGYALLVERWKPSGSLAALRPLAYLLPLALIPGQLAFVAGTSTNAHQLEILRLIQQYSAEDDAVIDAAGGALFRPHASYYWYHGLVQREIFADYFEHEIERDYRDSHAMFWIRDFRGDDLPEHLIEYRQAHYIPLDGDLMVLGRTTAPGRPRRSEGSFDIVRAGDYYVLSTQETEAGPVIAGLRKRGEPPLWIDGVEVPAGHVTLGIGVHHFVAARGAPAYTITAVPADAFGQRVKSTQKHTPIFEYDRETRGALSR